MKKYRVVLKSESPYLQHRMEKNAVIDKPKDVFSIKGVNENDAEKAFAASYYDEESKNFYIPYSHLRGCFSNGGSKVKKGNYSLKTFVSAFFRIIPDKIFIPPYDTVDIRAAWNHNKIGKTSTRILVTRPMWSDLTFEFNLIYLDHLVDQKDAIGEDYIQKIIMKGITMFGIGNYGPRNGGEFGIFSIAEFEEIKN